MTYNGYTFTWQNGRELAAISTSDLSVSYKYNADGIRTRKTVNGVTTNYTLEGTNVVYETNGTDSIGTDSIWYSYDADGALVSMTLNGTTYYYVTNLQGDITALTDFEGNIVVEYVYDSWGKLVTTSGTLADTVGVKNPFRYRGYYYDTETGLYYLNSRYYDPAIKRFINADIYVDTGGTTLSTNVFTYCENSPVFFCDINGTWITVGAINALIICNRIVKKYLAIKNYTYNKKHDITSGYINGQGLGIVANLKFGVCKMSESGCGVIATYNLLKMLNRSASIADIALEYEWNCGTLLYGAFGLKYTAVRKFLSAKKISFTTKRTLKTINKYFKNRSGKAIIMHFNSKNIFDGAHYVAVRFFKTGGIRVYNFTNKISSSRDFDSLSEYLEGGSIIIAYCLRN